MIREYYRQMRKFGCNILAVVQQYDVLKASEVRGAVLGNSKMFFVTAQQSREDAKEIGAALNLSEKTVETINSLVSWLSASRRETWIVTGTTASRGDHSIITGCGMRPSVAASSARNSVWPGWRKPAR